MFLDYDTHIIDSNNNKYKIGTIVNQKLKVTIPYYDKDCIRYTNIINWVKQPYKKELLHITTSNRSAIRCTNDYTFLTYSKGTISTKSAESLMVGDLVVANSTASSSLLIKDKYLDILLGLVLGDGNLSKNVLPSTVLKITHGEKQKEYLLYKKTIVKQLFTDYLGVGISGFTDNKTFQASSRTFIDTNNLVNTIYNDKSNKNTINSYLANRLTKEAWSLIFQDDGSYSADTKTVTFALCTFSLESLEFLRQSLIKLFNLSRPIIYQSNSYNFIRLTRKDTTLFLENIKNLIHPAMLYKLPNDLHESYVFTPIIINDFIENFSIKQIVNISAKLPYRGNIYNLECEHSNIIVNNLISG